MALSLEDLEAFAGQPEGGEVDLDKLAEQLGIKRTLKIGPKAYRRFTGINPQTQAPKYKVVYPSTFNDSGEPYFNDDKDMKQRAAVAMEAATVRSAREKDQKKRTAVYKLNKLDAEEAVDLISSMDTAEANIYLEAEASPRGQQRTEVLDVFDFSVKE